MPLTLRSPKWSLDASSRPSCHSSCHRIATRINSSLIWLAQNTAVNSGQVKLHLTKLLSELLHVNPGHPKVNFSVPLGQNILQSKCLPVAQTLIRVSVNYQQNFETKGTPKNALSVVHQTLNRNSEMKRRLPAEPAVRECCCVHTCSWALC